MKDLVIIGGASPESLPVNVGDYRRIIAADSGYDTAKRLGLVPSVVLGDFDSTALYDEIISEGFVPCPRDKDDTDAAMAIREAGGEYDLVGGGEGRLDHTLSLFVAFRTISAPSKWFMRSDTLITAEGHFAFSAPRGTDISIIPLDKSIVTTDGLRWDITSKELSGVFISQSNRVQERVVTIDCTSPVFLRFFPEDYTSVEVLC